MKKNLTHVAIILDSSGSMQSLWTDAIGNINKFLADQRALPGEITTTVAVFSSNVHMLRTMGDASPIDPPFMGHMTALYDAVGKVITDVGAAIAAMKEEDRPAQVIVAIMTDGEENQSSEYDLDDIKSMIDLQTKTYNWKFLFLGANFDVKRAGQKMGLVGGSLAYNATPGGTQKASELMSSYVSATRGGHSDVAEVLFAASSVDDASVEAAQEELKKRLQTDPNSKP